MLKTLGILILNALLATALMAGGFAAGGFLGLTNWTAFLLLMPTIGFMERVIIPDKFSLPKLLLKFAGFAVLAFIFDTIWNFGTNPLFIMPIFWGASYLVERFYPASK